MLNKVLNDTDMKEVLVFLSKRYGEAAVNKIRFSNLMITFKANLDGVACYDNRFKVIYISDDLNGTDIITRSVIKSTCVHELTHVIQANRKGLKHKALNWLNQLANRTVTSSNPVTAKIGSKLYNFDPYENEAFDNAEMWSEEVI